MRAWSLARFGALDVGAVAGVIEWHRGRVHAVLQGRVCLCIDKLATLSFALGTTPAAMLRQQPAAS